MPSSITHSQPAIEKAVDEAFASQVEWLSRFVRFKSLRGQEGPCQTWLQSEFERRGWSVDRFTLADVVLREQPGYAPMPDDEERSSVQLVASVPTARQPHGKSVILQGHVDVVPEGPEEFWTRPPFSGEVEDSWLYGRGAQDMKMGVSALVFALDAIKAAGFVPAAPVFVQAVAEEESTGNGALAALVRGYRADACLIPEPTSNTITRAQTGAVWFKLRVFAKPVHVARMETGANAILLVFPFLDALQKLTDEFNKDAVGDQWFGGVTNPVKFNPGMIRGGDWASSTPSWCEVDCRMGVLPSVMAEAVMNRILETVHDIADGLGLRDRAAPQVVWNGFRAEGAVLLPGNAAEACLAKAHEKVFGQPMRERLSTAVNDTRYHNLYFGIPGLCYGPRGKGMHGVDERADLANLRMTTLVIANFIASWCGLAPDESQDQRMDLA